MKRWLIIAGFLSAVYFACGFYIVGGNEKGLVRRFGKAQFPLVGSGLHYDLPWPWTTISRINPNEIRTITIGTAEDEAVEGDQFLLTAGQFRMGEFLTGDKNILNLQVNVQFRISEASAEKYLFASVSAEEHLRLIVESSVADLVSGSGVDYVHPLGLAELQSLLTQETRRLTEEHDLGLHVEDVTIGSVYPPVMVKQAFLDVSDARASMDQYINEALAYREQTEAAASASAHETIDRAETYRGTTVEASRGASDRFLNIIEQFRADEKNGVQSYAQSRQMALRQKYLETIEEVIPKLAGKIFLDSEKPVDLILAPETAE